MHDALLPLALHNPCTIVHLTTMLSAQQGAGQPLYRGPGWCDLGAAVLLCRQGLSIQTDLYQYRVLGSPFAADLDGATWAQRCAVLPGGRLLASCAYWDCSIRCVIQVSFDCLNLPDWWQVSGMQRCAVLSGGRLLASCGYWDCSSGGVSMSCRNMPANHTARQCQLHCCSLAYQRLHDCLSTIA